MRVFTAIQTFESHELQSTYCKGMSYTIRPGNRYLNALAEVWALEGKIIFAHIAPEPEVIGIGTVTETLMSDDPSIWDKTKKAGHELWQSLIQRRLELASRTSWWINWTKVHPPVSWFSKRREM